MVGVWELRLSQLNHTKLKTHEGEKCISPASEERIDNQNIYTKWYDMMMQMIKLLCKQEGQLEIEFK